MSSRFDVPVTVEDYASMAHQALPQDVWDYIAGGAGDEISVRANRTAFKQMALRPRVLVDVSKRDLTTTLLGQPVAAPIGVAPMAYHQLTHPDAEIATVQAAGAAGLVCVAGTFASRKIEDIARASAGPLWFQVYCFRDRSITADLIRRAEDAGYSAVVLTVDTPLMGLRDRDVRNGFRLPADVRPANLPGVTGDGVAALTAALADPSLTWQVIDWIRGITTLPLVLKGILTGQDAALAVAAGADAIWVSNHGGRQVDGATATLAALPEVAGEAGTEAEIYLDGGIRRGTDVIKALALGARAVFTGRPVLWGLATAGLTGARHVLDLLTNELDHALALCGCPGVAGIDPGMVRPHGCVGKHEGTEGDDA
jgi:4-hydroxymandelate oxidase